MKVLFKFGEELFWTGFWVFLALIVGYIILNYLSAKGGFIGSSAGWVAGHASDQYAGG
jgi:hypothetical protein